MSNLASIYNTPAYWYAGVSYKLHDVIQYQGYYYYCSIPHVSSTFATDLNASRWAGRTTFNGVNYPSFSWKPSYGSQVQSEPKVRTIKFGEGYSQKSSDGINNNLLKVNYNFDLKSDDEATAILHFLHVRAGIESFVFTAPRPYGMAKKFVCPNWSEDFSFADNHKISALFEETP